MPENRNVRDTPKHEIAARLMAEHPEWKQQYAHYMAGKLKRLVQRRELTWFEALRNLGIISDPTPREAIRNIDNSRRTVAA